MHTSSFRLFTSALLLVGFFGNCTAVADSPNLLLIIADDLGYGDLGCTGSTTIQTPNIDNLARQGILCTQAYVTSSVCSPSRAGLMTGRDPRRFGYEGNLNEIASHYATRPELLGLPANEYTLADHMKAAGYTTGLIGKWHLGDGDVHHPNRRGFDYFCGMIGGGHNYFPTKGVNKIVRNQTPVTEFSSEYLTDFFTDEAIHWIDQQSTAEERKPWMLVLSYNAPHTPMQAKQQDLELYQHIADPKRRTYAAMVHGLDRGIGRVVERLQQLDQWSNTLVVFLSDNGGATTNASWNGPLSGAKGTLREGGVRVPMIWCWHDTLAGGQQQTSIVSSLDILPTFLAAANSQSLELAPVLSHQDAKNRQRAVKQYGAYDGSNLLPTFSGTALPPRTLYWRLQGQIAVFSDQYKLIRLSHRPAQLFQPAADPAESHDLASEQPDLFYQLHQKLGQWESTATTAPAWDSSPRWRADSARIYDTWQPRPEPGTEE